MVGAVSRALAYAGHSCSMLPAFEHEHVHVHDLFLEGWSTRLASARARLLSGRERGQTAKSLILNGFHACSLSL